MYYKGVCDTTMGCRINGILIEIFSISIVKIDDSEFY